MDIFCTLFDSNYLVRGLALYQSLVNTKDDFELYVFAFDDKAYQMLINLALPKMKVISLEEFEDERLLKIKQTRTRGEYCWTCSCFSILYMLKHYDVSEVTYLDSDIFFFSSPHLLLDEFHKSNKDVLITEHRYTKEYDQTATSGKYCVQFMTFKNNTKGLNVLNWWCDRCEEWCYARIEDGKFGDQKYLDDWTDRFDCVHVLQHLGGGVAPWNVQQYDVTAEPCVNGLPVVFYHFHALKWLSCNKFDLSHYKLQDEARKHLYYPYIDCLKNIAQSVGAKLGMNLPICYYKQFCGIKGMLKFMKSSLARKYRGTYNVISR